ncbi:MAG TPA: pantoate--beta-alanine ligase [Candidatus Dormibacteraeota bacterium]|nr:pantoate--beta-alanine ligase [Candidatus Dormibacteraeota bacterium]
MITTPAELRRVSERWRSAGLSLGLVPTMGALHAGHRSLVRRARAECDRVLVTIFVNPAQFGPGEDLDRYPRPRERDLEVCAQEHADAVYAPRGGDVYPPGFATTVRVTGTLTSTLEGAARPGHLDGVALVVAKLLAGSRADRAYFGEKDAQQCALVRRLASDLDLMTAIVPCATVRDEDGLALSSRNAYLSAGERAAALAIPRGLAAAAVHARAGVRDARTLVAAVRAEIERSDGVAVDYVAAVDGETFDAVDVLDAKSRIQVAARIGTTRLIDTLRPLVDEPPFTPARARLEPGVATGATGHPGLGPEEQQEPCAAPS